MMHVAEEMVNIYERLEPYEGGCSLLSGGTASDDGDVNVAENHAMKRRCFARGTPSDSELSLLRVCSLWTGAEGSLC